MSNEITRSVLVDAPVSLVFRALTDEEELVRWMPRRAKMDAKVGGEYEFEFYAPARDSSTMAKGKVVELVPGKKVAYTFASSRDPPWARPSLMTWTVKVGSDGKTLVTLVHSCISGDSYSELLAWDYYIKRLAAYCSRQPA